MTALARAFADLIERSAQMRGTQAEEGSSMTTTETPLADKFTTVVLAGTGVTMTAEKTASPYLVITPVIANNGITEHLMLTHVPTGQSLPGLQFGDSAKLRELAENVAHLDWDFTIAADFPAETRSGYIEARRAIEFAQGEQIARSYPEGWEDNPRRIPGTADAMVRWLLDSFRAIDDHMGGKGPDRIPSDVDGKVNPAFIQASREKVDLFGLAYLLAALRRVAPEVADHATAFLAEQWDYGDSLGEFVWEWHQELEAGEPLKLPAVPSPEPAEGELFT